MRKGRVQVSTSTPQQDAEEEDIRLEAEVRRLERACHVMGLILLGNFDGVDEYYQDDDEGEAGREHRGGLSPKTRVKSSQKITGGVPCSIAVISTPPIDEDHVPRATPQPVQSTRSEEESHRGRKRGPLLTWHRLGDIQPFFYVS